MTRRRRAEYTQEAPQVNAGNPRFQAEKGKIGSSYHRVAPTKPAPYKRCPGEVPEWSIGTVSKTVVRASVPWVRIPPSPPISLTCIKQAGGGAFCAVPYPPLYPPPRNGPALGVICGGVWLRDVAPSQKRATREVALFVIFLSIRASSCRRRAFVIQRWRWASAKRKRCRVPRAACMISLGLELRIGDALPAVHRPGVCRYWIFAARS